MLSYQLALWWVHTYFAYWAVEGALSLVWLEGIKQIKAVCTWLVDTTAAPHWSDACQQTLETDIQRGEGHVVSCELISCILLWFTLRRLIKLNSSAPSATQQAKYVSLLSDELALWVLNELAVWVSDLLTLRSFLELLSELKITCFKVSSFTGLNQEFFVL